MRVDGLRNRKGQAVVLFLLGGGCTALGYFITLVFLSGLQDGPRESSTSGSQDRVTPPPVAQLVSAAQREHPGPYNVAVQVVVLGAVVFLCLSFVHDASWYQYLVGGTDHGHDARYLRYCGSTAYTTRAVERGSSTMDCCFGTVVS